MSVGRQKFGANGSSPRRQHSGSSAEPADAEDLDGGFYNLGRFLDINRVRRRQVRRATEGLCQPLLHTKVCRCQGQHVPGVPVLGGAERIAPPARKRLTFCGPAAVRDGQPRLPRVRVTRSARRRQSFSPPLEHGIVKNRARAIIRSMPELQPRKLTIGPGKDPQRRLAGAIYLRRLDDLEAWDVAKISP